MYLFLFTNKNQENRKEKDECAGRTNIDYTSKFQNQRNKKLFTAEVGRIGKHR